MATDKGQLVVDTDTLDHPVNAMTVDVEDYFHVSALASVIPVSDWERIEHRVEANTDRVLQLFADAGVSATFFILGWVAERYPRLVHRIHDAGHEVGCHGYSHRLIYQQKPQVFRDETLLAKRILEDTISAAVYGYRAASFSVTKDSVWALEMIAEAGFDYDSSIVPTRHDLYGMANTPSMPYRLRLASGASLKEFPPSTFRALGWSIPVGGGYFRILPYWFTRWGLKRLRDRQGQAFGFYMHPWELDPGQPRFPAPLKSKFRHYANLHRFEERLRTIMGEFRFGTMADVLDAFELDSIELDRFAESTPRGRALDEA